MSTSELIPLRTLSAFNFQNSAEWPDWIQEFEDFRFASGLSDKPEKTQVRTLLYIMGREARRIFASFELSAAEEDKYNLVKDKFNSHFVIRYNEVYESAKFNLRKQEVNETVDQFATALFSLAEHCNFGTLRTRLIRDRFVVGLLDKQLSESLQLDAKLTFETALEKARQKEAVKLQQQNLSELTDKTPNISAIKHQYSKTKQIPVNRKNENKNPQKQCCYCGGKAHPRPQCPANQAICNSCKKKGHFAKACLTRKFSKKSQIYSISQTDNGGSEEYCVGGIETESEKSLHVEINLNDSTVNFKVDSGAEVSIVSPSTPGIPKELQKCSEILKGPDGSRLKVLGKFDAVLHYNNRKSKQKLFVVHSITEPLLGWPALKDLEIIKLACTVQNDIKNKEYYKVKYPTLFNGLGKMKGEHKIILEPDAVPYSVHVARRVPIPLRKKVKQELDRMQKLGVIKRVTYPTKWCASLVPVQKPAGDVRICVDFTKLNKYVNREKTIMPTVEESLALLGEAKVFSKLDANSGFFQIPLTKDCQHLTTFITPFGRYCFTRLPFGITSAPEHFQQRMAHILEGLPGVVNQTDDTLVFGKNETEHNERLERVLRKLVAEGVTLNDSKCAFGVTSVKFLGHIVDKDGIRPDSKKVSAIMNIQPPSNVSEVRRILGMINHVARFLPDLSSKTEPIRALLGKNAEFRWDSHHTKALDDIKSLICSPVCLAKYNPKYETILSADASSFGLGSVLLQKQPTGEIRAVAYASRSLTSAETRYSQIEKEALAITWAAERFQQFILGLHIIFETDHKPLVPLLGKMDIEQLPPRIQRFRIRLMRYNYEIIYVPGNKIGTADTLSRSPESDANQEDSIELETEAYVSYVIKSIPASEDCLNNIKDELKKDHSCSLIIKYCKETWPEFRNLPSDAAPFWKHKEELTFSNGLLLKGPRLVIPKSLQRDILLKIHDGHLGIAKCRSRAKESVWWPGLSSQIKEMVTFCPNCVKTRHQNAEPLIPSEPPSLPWEKVATDLFEWRGKHYLLVVDYFSRFPELCCLTSLTSRSIIINLKEVFARHGIPNVVVSDNGPQYSSGEFTAFASEYGFCHVTSSPHYPQANGEAERMVQTMKNLLERSSDPYLALLTYRNTPGPTGSSPAQLSMGRRLRTRLPVHPSLLRPKYPNLTHHLSQDRNRKNQQKLNFDRRHLAHELKPLKSGEKVWIPDMKTPAVITSKANTPRSYIVRTPKGEDLRRNRRHLISMSPEETVQRSPADEDFEIKKNSETVPPSPLSPKTITNSPNSFRYTRSGRLVKPPHRLDL